MAGYFISRKQCDECNRHEGTSPSGDRSLGIDESGRCDACRAFVQRPCVVCEGTITSRQNVVYLGPRAKHKVCGALVKGKY
jgi:hypothetical protein